MSDPVLTPDEALELAREVIGYKTRSHVAAARYLARFVVAYHTSSPAQFATNPESPEMLEPYDP